MQRRHFLRVALASVAGWLGLSKIVSATPKLRVFERAVRIDLTRGWRVSWERIRMADLRKNDVFRVSDDPEALFTAMDDGQWIYDDKTGKRSIIAMFHKLPSSHS